MVNTTEIPMMFAPPFNVSCSINEWYVSNTSSTERMADTNDTFIRLMQKGRTERLDAIWVNSTQGLTDHSMTFRMQKFLRSHKAPF